MKVTGSFGEKVVAIGVTSGSFTGSLFGTASWAYNAVTASYALNAGTGNVSGSQYYVAVFSGSDSVVTGSIYDSGSFTGIGAITTTHPGAPERLFVDASDTDSYNLISGHGTINDYLQLNIKNFSSGISASSDIVATADNGDEFSYYIDMGINSAGYNIPDGIGQANDAYLYSTGQDLLIGNASSGKRVIIFNGSGPALDNARVYINSQGTVGVNASNPSLTNPEALLVEPLVSGAVSPNDFSNLIVGKGTINENYMQLNLTNLGTGSAASTDIVATNDIGDETSYYIDMGVNSSTFNVPNAVGTGSDAYLYSTARHLHIGNASNYPVQFFAGGLDSDANKKLQLNPNNSHELTGSLNATEGFTGSLFGTASWAQNALVSYTSSLALTASSADNFVVRNSLTASNALINGTITAQTLVVQTVTSSVVYSSGSNIFGNQLTDTQSFTGSVSITGSLIVNGNTAITSNVTASMSVASASFAQTASYAISAISSSYPIAVTGSALYSTSPASGIPSLYSLDNSIFFGQEAGYNAISANDSIFLGYRAGYSGSTANYSNFFGSRAGEEATDAFYSNFFGELAGYKANTARRSNFIGNQAGAEATYAESSNFLGYQAGSVATDAYHSNFLGYKAGYYATYAEHSNFIGERAGTSAYSASFSTLIGYKVAENNSGLGIGRNNIIIGTSITLPDNSQDSINIGGLIFGSGSYFDNAYYGNPFSGSANGKIGINQPTPIFNLDVSGSGRYTNGLQVTQSLIAPSITGSLFGTASWAINSISSSYAQTASYALATANVFPYTGSAIITGSLDVTGSVNVSGSTTSKAIISTDYTYAGWTGADGLYSDRTQIYRNYFGNTFGRIQFNQGINAFGTVNVGLILAGWDNNTNALHVIRDSNAGNNYIYIGSTTTNANKSASFQVDTPGRGVLLPRMGTAQYVNMSAPPQGLFLYDTGSATEGFYYFSSGSIKSWTRLLNSTGSQVISGSLTVTEGITGSLFGTASWAQNSITASYALNVSGTIANATTASYAFTASSAISSSFAISASYVPASGVVGLNLSQISTGSVTASVGISGSTFQITSGSSNFFFVSSSGNIGVNTINPLATFHVNGNIRVGGSFQATSNFAKSFFVDRYSNNPFADEFAFRKARGTMETASAVVADDQMGGIEFYGYDSSSFVQAAMIYTNVDGPVSVGSVPGRIGFYVNNGTGSSAQEVARVTSLGLWGFGKTNPGERIDVSGSVLVTGSLRVTSGITGSLFGTASWAQNAITASYALNVSGTIDNAVSASYAFTASSAVSSSQAQTASYVLNAVSSSYSFTASSAINSFAAISASNAATASSADNFVVRQSITASNALINGTITAQTLVVQTVTSSVVYSSGSNVFGNSLTNTQVFTGSVSVTGSLSVNGSNVVLSNQTGSMSVLSASFAQTASYVLNAVSSSYAFTASSAISASQAQTASYVLNAVSASFTQTASYVNPLKQILQVTGSIDVTGSLTLRGGRDVSVLNIVDVSSSLSSQLYSTNPVGSGADLVIAPGGGGRLINSGYAFRNLQGRYEAASGNPHSFVGASFSVTNAAYVNLQSSVLNTVLFYGGQNVNTSIRGYNNTYLVNLQPDGGNVLAGPGSDNGFKVQINPSGSASGSLWVSGSSVMSGSLTVTQGITGSLFGTASWAQNAVSASYVLNAISSSFSATSSLPLRGVVTASAVNTTITFTRGDNTTFDVTVSQSGSVASASYANYAVSASNALTASYVLNAISASYAFTASSAISSSFASTASYVLNAVSASYAFTASSAVNSFTAISASNAATASSADNLVVRQSITASNALITGTITAQTLVVSTVSSSVVYSSGSNIFGNSLTNTQQFTGSVTVTGSLAVNGSNVVLSNQTGSMSVLSASFAQTASNVLGGAPNYIAIWNTSSSLSSSVLYQSASSIGVGITTPLSKLHVVADTSTLALGSQPGIVSQFVYPVDGRTLLRVENNSGNAAAGATAAGLSLLAFSDTVNNPAANRHEAQILLGAKTSGQDGTLRVIAPRDINIYTNAQSLIMTGSNYLNYGTSAMFISSSGYVGIGTTSSLAIVDIRASNNTAVVPLNTSDLTGISLLLGNTGTNGVGALGHTNVGQFYIQVRSRLNNGQSGQILLNPLGGNTSIGTNATDNGYKLQLNGSGSVSGALWISGSSVMSGSLIVTQGITGSLFGTASWAQNALTSSYVLNAVSSSYAFTASSAISSSVALTASYANSGFDLGIAEFQTTSSVTVAGTTIVSSINTGSFTSAFYNYTIASGSNARSGQVMSVWNGSTVRYTEVTTTDIGNTATASFAVTLSGATVRLSFSAPGVWTVKSIANLL
jgi:hypothetical protein